MKRITLILVGLVIALGLSTAPAQAMKMSDARHSVVGGCIYKHDKHILSCVKGTYPFHRMIPHKHRWHKRTFYGVRVSGQHCTLGKHGHCWGQVLSGPIRAHNAPGRPVKGEKQKPINVCNQQICVNPFYWLTGTAKGIRELNNRIVDPCESGGLKGFGGGLLANGVAKAMLSSGAIGETTMLARFSSPEALAFLSISGCVAKVAQQGESGFDHFLFKLQHPFGFKHHQEVTHER